jgi:hypothetical protein
LPRLAVVAAGVVVVAAAVGYAEGARLARTLGGWQVICWALVIGLPVAALPTALSIDARVLAAPVAAWVGW